MLLEPALEPLCSTHPCCVRFAAGLLGCRLCWATSLCWPAAPSPPSYWATRSACPIQSARCGWLYWLCLRGARGGTERASSLGFGRHSLGALKHLGPPTIPHRQAAFGSTLCQHIGRPNDLGTQRAKQAIPPLPLHSLLQTEMRRLLVGVVARATRAVGGVKTRIPADPAVCLPCFFRCTCPALLCALVPRQASEAPSSTCMHAAVEEAA